MKLNPFAGDPNSGTAVAEKISGKPLGRIKQKRDVAAERDAKRAERDQAFQKRAGRQRQKAKVDQQRSAILAGREQIELKGKQTVLTNGLLPDTAQLDAELAASDLQLADLADDGSGLVERLEAECDALQEELIRGQRLPERLDAGKAFRAALARHDQQPFFQWFRDVHEKADAAREAEARLESDISELRGDGRLRFIQKGEVARAVEAALPQSATPAEVAGFTLWLFGEWLRLPHGPVTTIWQQMGIGMNHAGGSILFSPPMTETDLATLQSGSLPRL